MRNEAYCGVCNIWLRCGLSNHSKGKRHLALLAKINERIADINLTQGKRSAVPISDEQSKRDEQTKQ